MVLFSRTFKVFNSQEFKEKQKPAPSSKRVSKEAEEAIQKGLEKKMGRLRKRADSVAGDSLEGDHTKAVEKPHTRSR